MRNVLVAVTSILALSAVPVAAQKAGRATVPTRPAVGAAADTNDAAVYFRHGLGKLSTHPREAADAFYWASRLEPELAEPLYARRVALLISNPKKLTEYLEGNRKVIESAEMRGIDSLYLRALTRNPFLYRQLDRHLLESYISEWAKSIERRAGVGRVDRKALEFDIQTYLQTASLDMQAWVAYIEGRFPASLELYGRALRRAKDKADVHAEMARVHALLNNHAAAIDEMTLALNESRRKDDKRLVRLYHAKTIYEHSIGVLNEMQGNADAAREAYGRALQEDLSYYPAHQRISVVALQRGDTASALASLAMAVQIKEDDGVVRFVYGSLLAAAGQHAEAVEQLRHATELEPYFALPYFQLASALEAQGRPAEALASYEAFVLRSRRNHPERPAAERRIAALKDGGHMAVGAS
jgi:tetratricopeptide (TPR) repeat protein